MNQIKRYGAVIQIREEKIPEYKRLHTNAWPKVLEIISQANIRNYSIYLRILPDGNHYLFSHFEYTGDDYDADMAKMAGQPIIQKWWGECGPCQKPLDDCPPGQWWAPMEEVFYNP